VLQALKLGGDDLRSIRELRRSFSSSTPNCHLLDAECFRHFCNRLRLTNDFRFDVIHFDSTPLKRTYGEGSRHTHSK